MSTPVQKLNGGGVRINAVELKQALKDGTLSAAARALVESVQRGMCARLEQELRDEAAREGTA